MDIKTTASYSPHPRHAVESRRIPVHHQSGSQHGLVSFQTVTRIKKLCTIVLLFSKCEHQKIPMGLCDSLDIFQEKMDELFQGLLFMRAYINNLLCLTSGDFDDLLKKLEQILACLQKAGLKVNAKMSFFAEEKLKCLGYWIT